METIRDYYQIDDFLATSGQPTPQEFEPIAWAGYKVVINLATSKSTNALRDEGTIVTDLGMVYVHIPVLWSEPQLKDVRLFCKMMQLFDGQRIWVHCAKNMRGLLLYLSMAKARSATARGSGLLSNGTNLAANRSLAGVNRVSQSHVVNRICLRTVVLY